VDLAGLQLEVNALQRVNAGEIFLNALHFQNRFAHSNITFLIMYKRSKIIVKKGNAFFFYEKLTHSVL
jgi:hypothetical protein